MTLDRNALEAAWLAHDNACPGEHWKKKERMAAGITAYLAALPEPVQPAAYIEDDDGTKHMYWKGSDTYEHIRQFPHLHKFGGDGGLTPLYTTPVQPHTAVAVDRDAMLRTLCELQHEGLCRDRDIETIADRILSSLSAPPVAGAEPVPAEVEGLLEAEAVIDEAALLKALDAFYDTDKGTVRDAIETYVAFTRPQPVASPVTEAMVERLITIGWNACRKSLYAVCEDVENEADRLQKSAKPGTASEEQHAKGYYAGSRYAAKSIARGFNSMEAIDDDNARAALEAALSPAPEKP